MTDKIPSAIWQGDIAVMGIKLKCFVLDDGCRIIDADSLAAFLQAMQEEAHPPQSDDLIEMVNFLKGADIPQFRMRTYKD